MKPYRKIPLPSAFKADKSSTSAADQARRLFPNIPQGARVHYVTSCSENSILYLVPKGKLVHDIRKAAHRSGCRVHPVKGVAAFLMMPAKLGIIDPTLVKEAAWNELCEAFRDAAPENIQFLLTNLSPHSATLPFHNVIPMPSALDASSLKVLMRQLRERPEVIRAFAPHYPFYLDQLEPGQRFQAIDLLPAIANDHKDLMDNAVEFFRESPDPLLTVSRLLTAQLYDFPELVERESGELPIYLDPKSELFALWQKTE